ncbi:hypothetical protein V6C32_10790 [Desulforamulus ruminis]|uniref:hypothetical protein n=1 Tax=Desulforamulus ruminis TaxID=1564 RepID=UPI002FDAA470
MAKEKIAFPSDIREDAAFLGVRMGDFLKIIFPASVVGIGCAMLPLPVLIRLIFFIGIPSFALIWIAADIPGHIRRRRRYRREPEEYRFSPIKKQKGMSDLVAVKAFYGPFIEFEDQSLAVVLRLDSTPWHTMEDAEADNVALDGFRMVIRDAYMAKAEILITQDAGRQLLRSEWDRQEKEYGERFVGKSASSFALDRVNYHRNLENSRGEECHLRISLSPEDAEFPRKPGNSEEQREMLAEMLTDLLEAIMKDLTPYHIAANVLGAEAVRDLGARQLNPIHYQHQAYSEEDAIAWTMEETEENKEIANTSSKEQKLKGLANRLQVYSRASVQIKDELSKFSKNALSSVLDKGKGGISVLSKYQIKRSERNTEPSSEEDEQNESLIQEKRQRVITVWNPTGNMKTITALNLAAVAAEEGIDTALLNYDLHCPDLDAWFDIKQTSTSQGTEKDAGIMTFGESLNPQLAAKLLREIKWGIKYLPAGNKFGNIGTPDFGNHKEEVQLFKDIIQQVKERGPHTLTIINAGCSFEYTAAYAGLTEADAIIVPTMGTPQQVEVIANQLKELSRIGIHKPVFEMLFMNPEVEIKDETFGSDRIELELNLSSYLEAALKGEPYYYIKGGWQKDLMKVL